MNQKRFWVLVLFLCAGALLITSFVYLRGADAQAPDPTPQASASGAQAGITVSDNDVNRVAKKLYCPVCPNTPLDVCTTKACRDWREQIREQLSTGWSDRQVMDYFVMQYGERVLAEPERRGFTSLVWMLPVLVAFAGMVLVWLVLRSWRVSRKTQPISTSEAAPVGNVSGDVLSKIEAEIRKLD